MVSHDESSVATAVYALQSCRTLACTCTSDQVDSFVQLVVQRLSASLPVDSDLAVCLLYAAAYVVRRFGSESV
jgi:hypothetical protein